jgi:hypothetical protein
MRQPMSSTFPEQSPPEQRVSDWPGISSWAVRYPSASAEPIQQFYDTTTKLTQEHGSLLKQIREGNFDAFKRIVDQGGLRRRAWQQLNLGQNIPPGVDLGPYLRTIWRRLLRARTTRICLGSSGGGRAEERARLQLVTFTRTTTRPGTTSARSST